MKKLRLLGLRIAPDLAIDENGVLTRLDSRPVYIHAKNWPIYPESLTGDLAEFEKKLNAPIPDLSLTPQERKKPHAPPPTPTPTAPPAAPRVRASARRRKS